MSIKKAKEKYDKSEKGKKTKKKWKEDNKEKIRKWKRDWANTENGKKQQRKYRQKSPLAMFSLYKASAKKRGLTFNISKETFVHMIYSSCSYCGYHPEKPERNGIDRIDNNKGYFKMNIVPCCKLCNQMKSKRTVIEFINQCFKIARHQGGQ